MAQDFSTAWRRLYGDTAVLGFALRTLEIPWVRFHSLPESKRYADSEAEFEVLLGRSNALGDQVFCGGSACWLVVNKYGPQDTHLQAYAELIREYALLPAFQVRWKFPGDDDEDAFDYHFHAGLLEWSAGAFDPLLKKIANDEVDAVWMSAETGAVFAPYDGGIDLFPPTYDEAARLKAQFSEWLSDHPEGL
jgi:hypothetical protein